MGQGVSRDDDDDDSIPEAESTNDSLNGSAEKKMDGNGPSSVRDDDDDRNSDMKIDLVGRGAPTTLNFDDNNNSKCSSKATESSPITSNVNCDEQFTSLDATTTPLLRDSADQDCEERQEKTGTSPRSSNKRLANYEELCIMKKARNRAKLKELGFGPASPLVSSKDTASMSIYSPRMPTLENVYMTVADSHSKSRTFPHRSVQIRQLKSLLLSTRPPMIPSPVFVSGSKGTGKSCIVRHVIQEVFRNVDPTDDRCSSSASASSFPPFAFVDCATTIHFPKTAKNDAAILHAIYDQFSPYRASRAINSPWKLHLELLDLDNETATATTSAGSSRLVVLDHADGITLDTLQRLLCLPNICWIILTRSSLLSLSGTNHPAISCIFLILDL
jgi:hypothetical protein